MHTYTETLEQKNYHCAGCKKTFYVPYYVSDWGYWYSGKICCSYHCMRALQAKDRPPEMNYYAPERKGNPRTPLTKTEINNIEKLLFRGISVRQTAKQAKRSEAVVWKIKKRLVSEGWITQN